VLQVLFAVLFLEKNNKTKQTLDAEQTNRARMKEKPRILPTLKEKKNPLMSYDL